MSNKNPFEIRTELLHLAKDYMDRQQELNMQFAHRAYESALDAGKVTAETWKDFVPAQYTVEELMKKANELYSFVAPTTPSKSVKSKSQILTEGQKDAISETL
jgi:ArsR family metal-binding transcriptional regulator